MGTVRSAARRTENQEGEPGLGSVSDRMLRAVAAGSFLGGKAAWLLLTASYL